MCSVVLAAPAGSTTTTRTYSGTGLLASKLIISTKSRFSFLISQFFEKAFVKNMKIENMKIGKCV